MDFNAERNFEEINKFIHDLPRKLRVEVSEILFKDRYQKLKFFATGNRSNAFIAWMCPLLQPMWAEQDSTVFESGDTVTSIYF